eukprot:gb/GEZN01023572.1/.p1 GENE.gb/GEZN01023572.1/~~gb/GEZN01023572.1/.p1  ORF type:complete len:106 (-),score=28.27 gb/GEZN01023572.1/:249-566(-)
MPPKPKNDKPSDKEESDEEEQRDPAENDAKGGEILNPTTGVILTQTPSQKDAETVKKETPIKKEDKELTPTKGKIEDLEDARKASGQVARSQEIQYYQIFYYCIV